MDFELTLKPESGGLLYAYWKIVSEKASGVLSLDGAKFKKQIIFRRGEPISVRSNLSEETFAAFLTHQKLIGAFALKTELKKKEKAKDTSSLVDWLVKEGLLQASLLPTLFQAHFQERLFSPLCLTEGVAVFKQVSDQYKFDGETQVLSEPFLKLLWEAVDRTYNEKWVRTKMAPYFQKFPQYAENFPLPIKPQDLRVWNQLRSKATSPKDLDLRSLKLLAIAEELGLVTWSAIARASHGPEIDISIEELIKEMRDLDLKFKTARPHEVLGVEFSVSPEECQKRYYELVRKYHPDRLSSEASSEQKTLSERVFAKINMAFGVLTDPEKRMEFLSEMELEKSGGVEAIQRRIEAEFLIPQAQQALKRRHFQAAYDLYAHIEKILTEDGEIIADRVYSEMMLLVEAKGDLSQRVKAFETDLNRSIKLKPKNASVFYYRGILSKLQGRHAEAVGDFKAAFELDPKHAEASSELRLIHMRVQKKR